MTRRLLVTTPGADMAPTPVEALIPPWARRIAAAGARGRMVDELIGDDGWNRDQIKQAEREGLIELVQAELAMGLPLAQRRYRWVAMPAPTPMPTAAEQVAHAEAGMAAFREAVGREVVGPFVGADSDEIPQGATHVTPFDQPDLVIYENGVAAVRSGLRRRDRAMLTMPSPQPRRTRVRRPAR